MQKKGVDISEHNGSVDFQALKNGGAVCHPPPGLWQ